MGVTLLDPKTTAALQRLLEASAARPLRDTSAAFTTAFPDGGTTAFHALACLLVLLKDGPPAQWEERLAGYRLLLTADALLPGLRAETFDAYLIEAALAPERAPSHEAAFVRCLLLDSGAAGPIDGLTPCRWARGGGPLGAPGPCMRQQLQMSLDRRRDAAAQSAASEDPLPGRLPLLWHRPPPPRPLPAQPCELAWASGGQAALQGGSDGERAVSQLSEHLKAVGDTLERGAADALAPADAQTAMAALQADGSAALAVALPPRLLPGLVRHNPGLAAQLLLCLADEPQVDAHFRAAAGSELGLQSMEVVSRLAQRQGPLPDGFLQDAAAAGRKVRLVSVFMASLARARLPDVLPLLAEAQAFCIRFSRVKEAAALFRLLKSLEGDEAQLVAA